ncbi:hypothetical protein BLOT_016600 [Blomia tropicalis]|nr:hypothetical protein BLOT_016600 [Blomia tropicalis]
MLYSRIEIPKLIEINRNDFYLLSLLNYYNLICVNTLNTLNINYSQSRCCSASTQLIDLPKIIVSQEKENKIK